MEKYKIVFERIANPNVISYEVLSNPINTRIQQRVFVIDNPKEVNPVKVKTTFLSNDNLNSDRYTQIFQLKHKNIFLDEANLLTVYKNGQEFDRGLVTINKHARQLFMYCEVTELDTIEIEYHIDGVEFEFETSHVGNTYTVRPMLNEQSSSIGKHSILV